MTERTRTALTCISAVSFCLFVASLAAMFVGVYVAIWGDNALGGRLVATGLVTAFAMMCIGIPIHDSLKKKGV